jgi:RNA polymerase sigma-70 factor (ECF subfamily)
MSWPQWSERVVHDQGVLASALSLAHDPDCALEAVHEAVRRTKPACDTGRITDYDHFRSSVRQTAVRALIDGYRRTKKYTPLPEEDDLLAEDEEDRDDRARADRIALVREVIERLPAEDRELVRLRFEEGLPLKEIAARNGTSISAVWTRLRQPLRKMRMWLLERDRDLFDWLETQTRENPS